MQASSLNEALIVPENTGRPLNIPSSCYDAHNIIRSNFKHYPNIFMVLKNKHNVFSHCLRRLFLIFWIVTTASGKRFLKCTAMWFLFPLGVHHLSCNRCAEIPFIKTTHPTVCWLILFIFIFCVLVYMKQFYLLLFS